MRTRESIWQSTTERREFPALSADEQADVAIVGAGITGLTAAVLLKRAGKKVIVLEKDRIGAGTSGLTTAHVSTLWDHGYHDVSKKYGEHLAGRVARSMQSGLNCIERFVHELSIACGFERVPGYYYAEKGQSKKQIEQEYDAAKIAGADVSWIDHVPLPFTVEAAFRVENQAQLQPLEYLEGLADSVHGDGSMICEHSRVVSISGSEVRLARAKVRAKKIILATHTPLGLSPIHAEIAPFRSFVLAARVFDPIPHALFWDAAEPYHYLRTHTIGDQTWLIAGGKDRKTAHGEEPAQMEALREYVRDRFKVIEIGWEWAAQLYEPSDHLPFIGRSPFNEDVLIATGFSGDGIPFGTMAGMILSELAIRGDHEYADLFRPERFHVKALPTLVKENADVAKSFVVDRLPGKSVDAEVAQLARGEGRVVGRGLSKMAIYKNSDGSVSRFSAVCPHMKCVVRWNEAQKSFDCPCHGSRFDCDGSVIEGPALEGLTKL